MDLAIYIFTIGCMVACIGASSVNLCTFILSQRRHYMYIALFFAFYFVEYALIFHHEFIFSNIAITTQGVHEISNPVGKILLGSVISQAIWMAVYSFYGLRSTVLKLAPVCAFVLLSALSLLIPDAQLNQWVFYSMRQFFLLWVFAFCINMYTKDRASSYNIRYRKIKLKFIILAVFLVCIIIEDTFVILIWNPEIWVFSDQMMRYLSQRNTVESCLVLLFAVFTFMECRNVLLLRSQCLPNCPLSLEDELRNRTAPIFCGKHNLTCREQEILLLVIKGRSNQEIAGELTLALGTIKTHIHNIFKKTDTSNRNELISAFWAEK